MLIRSLPSIIKNIKNLEDIQNYNIYNVFINLWLERGIKRLGDKAKKMEKDIRQFCEEVALNLVKNN